MPPLSQLLANNAPVNENDPNYDALLAQLQCNILSSHGRRQSVYFFLNLPDQPAAARKLCKSLAHGDWPGAPARVALRAERDFRTERAAVLIQKRNKSFNRATLAEAPFAVNLLLSASGYRKLGDLNLPEDSAFGRGLIDNEIANPLSPKLNDRAGVRLVPGLGPDALYIVAAHPEQDLTLVKDAVRKYLGQQLLLEREGRVLVHKTSSDSSYTIEPFGYRDSISMPRFFAADLAELEVIEGAAATPREGKWSSYAPLSRVLVPDPNVAGDACGTYFAFRQLRQHVADFYRQAKQLADVSGGNASEIADGLVGRRLDGTPLVASHSNINDFNYEDAPSICPAHAHIRKVNPRDSWSAKHQIVRRATVYGPALERETNGRPRFQNGDVVPVEKGISPTTVDTGLLFLCAQSDITQQFLVLQANWANATSGGADTIAGSVAPGQTNKIGIAVPGQPFTGLNYDYRPVVEALGGEYFFAPSLTFFSQLITEGASS
jgi:Dyp-type peroxidase family